MTLGSVTGCIVVPHGTQQAADAASIVGTSGATSAVTSGDPRQRSSRNDPPGAEPGAHDDGGRHLPAAYTRGRG